jgi:hypothetical protein
MQGIFSQRDRLLPQRVNSGLPSKKTRVQLPPKPLRHDVVPESGSLCSVADRNVGDLCAPTNH